MRMVSIASGSSGNCIYIGSDKTHILVDAGISNKRIQQGLNDIGLKGGDVDGILITHEHSDHIKGLGVLARKYQVPIYATRETLDEIRSKSSLGDYDRELLHPVCPDVDFVVGDLTVKPFSIDHDAANPVAYRVQCGERSVAVATDMGHYDQYIIDHRAGLFQHDDDRGRDRHFPVLRRCGGGAGAGGRGHRREGKDSERGHFHQNAPDLISGGPPGTGPDSG